MGLKSLWPLKVCLRQKNQIPTTPTPTTQSAKLTKLDFPAHWIEHAIPYGQLKKCLKKVQRELQDLGLDPETLRALLDPDTASPVALHYKLDGKNRIRELRLNRPKSRADTENLQRPQTQGLFDLDSPLTSTSRMVSPSMLP